jgi:hypothetical protein
MQSTYHKRFMSFIEDDEHDGGILRASILAKSLTPAYSEEVKQRRMAKSKLQSMKEFPPSLLTWIEVARLVREGEFTKKSTSSGVRITNQRQVLLFNDLLLWGPVGENKYSEHVSLYEAKVEMYVSKSMGWHKKKDGENIGFTLTPGSLSDRSKPVTLWCENAEIRDAWLQDITQCIKTCPNPSHLETRVRELRAEEDRIIEAVKEAEVVAKRKQEAMEAENRRLAAALEEKHLQEDLLIAERKDQVAKEARLALEKKVDVEEARLAREKREEELRRTQERAELERSERERLRQANEAEQRAERAAALAKEEAEYAEQVRKEKDMQEAEEKANAAAAKAQEAMTRALQEAESRDLAAALQVARDANSALTESERQRVQLARELGQLRQALQEARRSEQELKRTEFERQAQITTAAEEEKSYLERNYRVLQNALEASQAAEEAAIADTKLVEAKNAALEKEDKRKSKCVEEALKLTAELLTSVETLQSTVDPGTRYVLSGIRQLGRKVGNVLNKTDARSQNSLLYPEEKLSERPAPLVTPSPAPAAPTFSASATPATPVPLRTEVKQSGADASTMTSPAKPSVGASKVDELIQTSKPAASVSKAKGAVKNQDKSGGCAIS